MALILPRVPIVFTLSSFASAEIRASVFFGWEGEGNRSALPRKTVVKTGGILWTVATEWFHLTARQLSGLHHAAGVIQDWVKSNCSDFITKDKLLPVHSISVDWIITFGVKCWSLTISCSQSQKEFPSWKTHYITQLFFSLFLKVLAHHAFVDRWL